MYILALSARSWRAVVARVARLNQKKVAEELRLEHLSPSAQIQHYLPSPSPDNDMSTGKSFYYYCILF